MVRQNESRQESKSTRRTFLKRSAALSSAALASGVSVPGAFAGGSGKIRVGFIGCGVRGSIDAVNCVKADPGMELYALGDLFEERRGHSRRIGIKAARKWLRNKLGDRMNVSTERCFTGFDAYKKVLDCDVDLVILTTPPHFRPQQLRAAIEAGKHAFIEKPVAVDPAGARHVMESAEIARKKGLGILAGTQRRHHAGRREIMKRIRNGAIGELVGGQCYYNGLCRGPYPRPADMSDMEWQIRNWYFFTWLSGDHIVEQHIHNIDVMNWAFGATPDRCMGMGGRQVRKGPEHGNIFDHFAVEYVYPNGARVMSMCRQIRGCTHRVGEHLVGTKGTSDAKGSIDGENPFTYEGKARDPSLQEHIDFIKSIRAGEPLNEGRQVAEATMTAIIGRMSAYTGKEISWKWAMNQSELNLGPDEYEFGNYTHNPVATPGKTPLV